VFQVTFDLEDVTLYVEEVGAQYVCAFRHEWFALLLGLSGLGLEALLWWFVGGAIAV
jgi:hypothetical protein